MIYVATRVPLHAAILHFRRALTLIEDFNPDSDSTKLNTTSILAKITLLIAHLMGANECVSDYVESEAHADEYSNEKADELYHIYENNQKIKVVLDFVRKNVMPHIAENDLGMWTTEQVPLERDFSSIYQAKARIEALLKLIDPS
jgi:hypothetical protein